MESSHQIMSKSLELFQMVFWQFKALWRRDFLTLAWFRLGCMFWDQNLVDSEIFGENF